jgi:hypothetical protein
LQNILQQKLLEGSDMGATQLDRYSIHLAALVELVKLINRESGSIEDIMEDKMAIGMGWVMAISAMTIGSSKDWFSKVLAAAGLDPRVDPVTGSIVDVEWNGVLWCYGSHFTYDREQDKYVGVNPRAQIVMDAIYEESMLGKDINDIAWHPYTIVDSDGKLVAKFEPGTRSGYLWRFEQAISSFDKPDQFPPIPECHIIWPSWWPQEKLNLYDTRHVQEITAQIALVKKEAKDLNILIGHRPERFYGSKFNWENTYHCEICSESSCPGAQYQDNWPISQNYDCQNMNNHPEAILRRWTGLVERRKQTILAKDVHAAKVSAAQILVNEALQEKGFWYDRLNGARFLTELL